MIFDDFMNKLQNQKISKIVKFPSLDLINTTLNKNN